MTRREKIILAMTGAVALVGIGSLFLGGQPVLGPLVPGSGKTDSAQIQALAKTAGEAGLDAREAALLAALQAPWRLAAVYDKPLEGKGQAAKAQAKHRYTGYVELGSGRLAVVDGYEYQVGRQPGRWRIQGRGDRSGSGDPGKSGQRRPGRSPVRRPGGLGSIMFRAPAGACWGWVCEASLQSNCQRDARAACSWS